MFDVIITILFLAYYSYIGYARRDKTSVRQTVFIKTK